MLIDLLWNTDNDAFSYNIDLLVSSIHLTHGSLKLVLHWVNVIHLVQNLSDRPARFDVAQGHLCQMRLVRLEHPRKGRR